MDTRILASIKALRAFEAAARHSSFTDAAVELRQTQSAISHQIRELERRLEVKLFNREPLGISLTLAGKTYLSFVSESLDNLRAGELALKPNDDDNTLTVSCSPNFAHKWLVPRLGNFVEDNSDIELRISTSAQHITFEDDEIDFAIRHGDGCWPHLSVTQLCQEWIYPVCSPHFIKDKTIESLSDLSESVLIHDQQREGWADWLDAVGVDPRNYNIDHGLVLSQTSYAIDAALAVQGVTLARSALVDLDLAAGRLIRPVKEKVKAEFAYWIVCPRTNESRDNILRMKAWLISQTSSTKQKERKNRELKVS